MKSVFLVLVLALLAACSMPATTVRTVDDRPSISVQGAPSGAILYVDGLSMGSTDQYSGEPEVLRLEPGTHDIRVVKDGAALLTQRIFLGSAHKTIVIR